MIDRKKTSKALFQNTGIIALGQFGTKFLSFFLMPLYTAILSQEEYGLFDLLNTYSGVIIVIVGLQIYQALFRYIVPARNDSEEICSIVSTATLSSLAVLGVYLLIFACVSPLISIQHQWYLAVSVCVSILFQLLTNVTRGLGHNGQYAIASFLTTSITIVLNVLGIAVFHMGIMAMMMAAIVGSSVSIV